MANQLQTALQPLTEVCSSGSLPLSQLFTALKRARGYTGVLCFGQSGMPESVRKVSKRGICGSFLQCCKVFVHPPFLHLVSPRLALRLSQGPVDFGVTRVEKKGRILIFAWGWGDDADLSCPLPTLSRVGGTRDASSSKRAKFHVSSSGTVHLNEHCSGNPRGRGKGKHIPDSLFPRRKLGRLSYYHSPEVSTAVGGSATFQRVSVGVNLR